MYQVWKRRAGTRLTRDAYRHVGGVRGALAAWCTAVIDQLPDADKDCAQRVLTALVCPADLDRGVPAVRQQLRVDTLRQLIEPDNLEPTATRVDEVLAVLTGHRIVTTRTLPDTSSSGSTCDDIRVPVAELVHDALIRDWPQLRAWAADDHRFQDWLRRTDERHRHWQQHPTADDLLHGSDLAEGLDWAARRPLPNDVAAFLHATQHQLQARTRRSRRLNTILASLLTVVLAVAGVAVWQWRTAVTAQNVALSRQLAAQSAALLPSNSDLADLLAVEAYRISRTAEAIKSMHAAVSQPIIRSLGGHTARVSAIAYGPDGQHLASAGNDRTVRICDITTGTSRILAADTDEVSAVAYSPDHQHLASAGNDGVRIWDLATNTFRALTGRAGESAVAYSPDGQRLASAADDGVRIWDLASSTSRTLNGPTGTVNAIAYSPDGQHLASAGLDGAVRIWDLSTGASGILPRSGTVDAVAYSPDGQRLATGGLDGAVRIWDLSTGASGPLIGHVGPVSAVAYSSDRQHLASADGNGVRVWDLATGTSRTLNGHVRPVLTVAYSPDGQHLASAGYDGTVGVWDLADDTSRTLTGSAVRQSPTGRHVIDQVNAMAYNSDGQHLASADYQEVEIWDLNNKLRGLARPRACRRTQHTAARSCRCRDEGRSRTLLNIVRTEMIGFVVE